MSFFWDRNEVSPEDDTKEFCCVLIRGSCSNLTYIDEIIGTYSEHWRLTRMATIDRNILRIAIYELLYLRNIPPPVTINEAVELGTCARKADEVLRYARISGDAGAYREAVKSLV